MDVFELIFFRNALLGAFLASVACGIVGTYIVVRRLVFICGGITHASLGGVGIALYMGWPPLWPALGFSILSALGIRKLAGDKEEREDSLIAVFWTFGMAVGILFAFLTPGYGADLTTYLFGNILTITASDLYLSGAVVFVLLLGCALFFRPFAAMAFDADFMQTRGLPVRAMEYVMIVLTAVTVVAVLRIVGIVLALALLTIPQMTANLFTNRLRPMMVLSIGLAFGVCLCGLVVSYFLNIPSGSSIIVCACLVYVVARLWKKCRRRYRVVS
ncbi:MAG: metal ABC transporter permease [Bacteroidaceae bacterium]